MLDLRLDPVLANRVHVNGVVALGLSALRLRFPAEVAPNVVSSCLTLAEPRNIISRYPGATPVEIKRT